MKAALTLTVISNITANYGEALGNVSQIQKTYEKGKTYGIRSKESLKSSALEQAGFNQDLKTKVDGATQKIANEKINAGNTRALEGGYMYTTKDKKEKPAKRKSSIVFTDAVSVDSFKAETRFHNNLRIATYTAEQDNINIQEDAKKSGLMIYNYEFDKQLKKYSVTIDLDRVGVDENFNTIAPTKEKIDRVTDLLDTLESLELHVKGSSDNAEPIMVVGGIGKYKTHYFENVIKIQKNKLELNRSLKAKLEKEKYKIAVTEGYLDNDKEIEEELGALTVTEFFDTLREEVKKHYESIENKG